MKNLFTIIAMFIATTMIGQVSGTFKAISKRAEVPFSIYLNYDTMKAITSPSFSSLFTRASVNPAKAFVLADKNKDEQVTYKELTDALRKNLFYLAPDESNAKLYFLYLDLNQDGYLEDEDGLTFLDAAIGLIESIDHKKYAYTCGEATYDHKGKVRRTGKCANDERLSVSELNNAIQEKKLWIGGSLYWKS